MRATPAATPGGVLSGWRIIGAPAWTGNTRRRRPSDTGSPTAPHSRRLRMAGLGWSPNGARRS
jgi:hypothetical protein